MSSTRPTSVLFVCLGNICRSPLAEGVFRHLVRERGLDDEYRIESAGTGSWHVGEPADPRSADVASRHGITLTSRGRQVQPADLRDFDHVIAMDRQNLADLRRMADEAGGSATVTLLRDDDPMGADGPDGRDVPDPYYGGPDGFDRVYDLVLRSCRALLDRIEAERADR